MVNKLTVESALLYITNNKQQLDTLANSGDSNAENILNMKDVYDATTNNKAVKHLFVTAVQDYLNSNDIKVEALDTPTTTDNVSLSTTSDELNQTKIDDADAQEKPPAFNPSQISSMF